VRHLVPNDFNLYFRMPFRSIGYAGLIRAAPSVLDSISDFTPDLPVGATSMAALRASNIILTPMAGGVPAALAKLLEDAGFLRERGCSLDNNRTCLWLIGGRTNE
jgi:hypothetical protein